MRAVREGASLRAALALTFRPISQIVVNIPLHAATHVSKGEYLVRNDGAGVDHCHAFALSEESSQPVRESLETLSGCGVQQGRLAGHNPNEERVHFALAWTGVLVVLMETTEASGTIQPPYQID